MILVDNGDDKIFIRLKSKNKEPTSCRFNQCIPCLAPFNLMVAGTGDSVILKNLSGRY